MSAVAVDGATERPTAVNRVTVDGITDGPVPA